MRKTPKPRFKPTKLELEQIGYRVRVKMAELNFTCRELSEVTGYSCEYITNVRQGRQWLGSTSAAMRIASALNMSLDRLLFGL